jgi:bifunctional NMN adenylyltransferase/nudix hydrolase
MANRKYDYGIVIGRFQPFHQGHKTLLKAAFEVADHVIILCGSAGRPRSQKNPWTVEERKRMIDLALHEYDGRYVVEGIVDYAYSNQKWLENVQKTVDQIVFNSNVQQPKVALIGHKKDDSTFYLDMFPMWAYEEVNQGGPLDATTVRELYFDSYPKGTIAGFGKIVTDVVSEPVIKFLNTWRETEGYKYVKAEKDFVEETKRAWNFAPYEPKFVTGDAILVESGHVALIKRGAQPGLGQWALPGGHLDPNDENTEDCVVRELYEELGVDAPERVIRGSIVKNELFSKKDRDPRGRYVTDAFLIQLPPCPDPKHTLTPIKAGDDAEKGSATWVPLSQIDNLRENMFLDHYDIIKKMTGGI